jgi:hypothetical protein
MRYTSAMKEHIQSLGAKWKEEDREDFEILYQLRKQYTIINSKISTAINTDDIEGAKQWSGLLTTISNQINILSNRFLSNPKSRLTAKEEQRIIDEEATQKPKEKSQSTEMLEALNNILNNS